MKFSYPVVHFILFRNGSLKSIEFAKHMKKDDLNLLWSMIGLFSPNLNASDYEEKKTSRLLQTDDNSTDNSTDANSTDTDDDDEEDETED